MLIDKHDVLNAIGELFTICSETLPNENGRRYVTEEELIEFYHSIMAIPTIDAVPVVMCRDCKHHEVFKNGVNGWCNGHGCPTDVTYFCADGERKDGDTDGE
jgi:hypothetical protein